MKKVNFGPHIYKDISDSSVITLEAVSGKTLNLIGTWNGETSFPVLSQSDYATISDNSNALETDITSVGVPFPINATPFSVLLDNFTMSASGALTYTGLVSKLFKIHLNLTVKKINGGADMCSGVILKNSVAVADTGNITMLTTTIKRQFSMGSITLIEPGDIIEAAVANETQTHDITVTNYTLRISLLK